MKPLRYGEYTTKRGDEKFRKVFTKRFAKYLRRVRKAKKLSQEQLSFKAGLSATYVSHIEQGRYAVSLYIAWKLAQAMEVSLSEFLADFS